MSAALVAWCEEMAAWCKKEDTPENARQFTVTDEANWLECARLLRMRGDAGWISVKDRLPDDEASVLIAIEGTEGEPVWIGFHEGEQWFSDDAMPQRVTHWMPMIEGPK